MKRSDGFIAYKNFCRYLEAMMFSASIFGEREAHYAQYNLSKILAKHPVKFEEGKWVAPAEGTEIPNLDSAPLCFWQDSYYVLGKRDGSVSLGFSGERTSALISDDPFLVVYVMTSKSKLRNGEIVCSESVGGFNPARLVKNGKLGRMPKITMCHPRYVRLKGGRWRWANLKELCDIIGMDAQIILETYLAVADPRLIEAQDKTEMVTLPKGMTEADADFSMIGRIRPFTRVRHVNPKLPQYHDPMIVDTNLFTYFKTLISFLFCV